VKKLLPLLCLLVSSSAFAVDPFSLPWINSEQGTYSSTEYPNGIFVINNFWNGCDWCHILEDSVQELAGEYASQGRVQILDVGVDQADASYFQWIDRHRPNHPVLKDVGRALANELGSTAYPTTYVLDCHLDIKLRLEGAVDSWRLVVKDKVDELLRTPCE
jgi:hypothetical protein